MSDQINELLERCCAAADSMQPAASQMIKWLAALLRESLERSQRYHEDRVKTLEEHIELQKQHIELQKQHNDLWKRYTDLQEQQNTHNDKWIKEKLAELPLDTSRPN